MSKAERSGVPARLTLWMENYLGTACSNAAQDDFARSLKRLRSRVRTIAKGWLGHNHGAVGMVEFLNHVAVCEFLWPTNAYPHGLIVVQECVRLLGTSATAGE